MKLITLFLFTFCAQMLFAVDILPDDVSSKVDPIDFFVIFSLSKILWTLLFFVIAYIFITLLTKVLEFFAEKSAKARIPIKGFVPILRIALWTLFIIAIIKIIYNPPKEMLLTTLASVAIAVGFATQDLLKNIFGGIMLLFDRPFKVGDKIEVGDNYGEVINIGLRATRIVTPDDSMVVVPNMELMNTHVSNSNSGELYCQVVAKVMLPIDAPMDRIRKIAIEAAQVSRYVYLNEPIVVLFSNKMNENRSYLEMKLKAYVMDIRYEFKFKSDMTEIVIKELLSQGIINKDDLN
ncbi:mechanosensitive ion channel [Sulfurimonas crateris]|uniref:Mechanosensitive ion channel n=1 Tax=Sulfurimonas crateris TaxID=2574727 RepID=A0A4U2ZBM2_9BACT|nr:mechanosensitive ion channel domain-containing protein [Sulfurimonas crateris]TKI70950.1 mechanosensitive ion channel [Sulfurimonas crateris]